MRKKIMLPAVIGLLFAFFLAIDAQSKAIPNLLPQRLHADDTVGLVSSAFRAPEDQEITDAVARLHALGLHVKLGRSVYQRNAYFAGTDRERAEDLNRMFADPKVKAIFEVRGGWGSARILPYLNYTLIQKNPKILIGFSDITALLLAIHAKTGLVTFHGTLGTEPWPEFTVNYMKQLLFENEKVTFRNPNDFDAKADVIQTKDRIAVIRSGEAQGRLLGGNLTTLTALLGSSYLPSWHGAILFVEDVDENYYQIDRMMAQLKMAGVLNQISGFVFGQCVNCTAGDSNSSASVLGSQTLAQILNHYIKPLHIPAWSGAMIGHDPQMFTLPEGAWVRINANQGSIILLQPALH